MTKISYVMISGRSDFPYTKRPDLHLFTPTLECFKAQTFTDFEVVIVDVLYEQRKDYFKDLKLPFTVKHIPALPNQWIEKGLPGICTQLNKGIIHTDGEMVFIAGDSLMFQPNFMESLWREYRKGYFPLAWYFYDNSFVNDTQGCEAPVKYSILGFDGKKVALDHRYVEKLQNNSIKCASVLWDWWFGYSSASLEAMLKINGFDQRFDGDQMLLDCDVGSRLDLAGYGDRFALFRDIYVIKIPSERTWNPIFTKKNMTIKCNYPLMYLSREFGKYRANAEIISNADIAWMKDECCGKLCQLRESCKRDFPWQYPFEHKEGYGRNNSSKELFNFWREHQTVIDLAKERELRLNGTKYQEGTFI